MKKYLKKFIAVLCASFLFLGCNNNVKTTDDTGKSNDNGDYIMTWNINKGVGVSLAITGGQPSSQALSPKVGDFVNEGYPYAYVVFQSINVDIYTGASGGGQKLASTTINMVTKGGNTYPSDTKNLLSFKYNAGKSKEQPYGWNNWFDITYSGTTPPTVTTNNGWSSGLGNTDEVAKTNESFFVADYGEEKGRWTTHDGALWQTTKVIENNVSSRIYAVKLVEGDKWSFEQGIGVAKDGLWQIDIQIGSDGLAPFCETFYLAERKNLAPGVSNYLDGNGGGDKGGGFGREIDVMETQWQHNPAGPQASLANVGGGTAWNSSYGNVRTGLWTDIGGAPNKQFATYGVLIRDNNLWIYSYKPDGSVWYCSDAIPNTNTGYNQEGNFVAYIGTWNKHQVSTTGFSTGYNNFIYLSEDDPKIKGKNPKDDPKSFGNTLK